MKIPKYQFQKPSSMYNFDLRSQYPIHLNPNIPTVHNSTSWLITHKFVHQFSWIIKHQFEIHPTTTRHKTSKIINPNYLSSIMFLIRKQELHPYLVNRRLICSKMEILI